MSKLSAKEWLMSGGGGYEEGEDGIRATTFTVHGVISLLESYEEYLREEFIKEKKHGML
jgi:hypothetical protein